MISTTSSVSTENHEEENSTLTAGLAALALGNQLLHPPTTINGNSIPDDISFRSSTSTNRSFTMRSFIDPGLITPRRPNMNETWLNDFISPKSAPQGAYSPISQAVKKLLPERAACRFGCKGASCKYESSDYWRPEQMAIKGIFSTWVTDSILACSRPTVRHSELKQLFYDADIRAIFNLEKPDEHLFCGHGNHASGFSYDPVEFMDVGIFVYNYAMEDYGTVKVETILDIMKVMSFAMKQGKIAVHCHAGLGRTGFVICSYLVHEYRMSAHEAIHYIRAKRPGSVQMTKQIQTVEEYEQFIAPKRRTFTDSVELTDELSLDEHLRNQQAFIHGRDAYIYKNIPRVLFVCAARLIELCTGFMIDTILLTINRRSKAKPVFVRENLENLTEEEKSTWLDFAPSFFYEHARLANQDFSPFKQILHCMLIAIREEFLTAEQQTKVSSWKQKINKKNNGVDEVFEETDPCVISALLWSWLRILKYPVLTNAEFHFFTKTDVEQPLTILSKLNKFQCGTIEFLAKMFAFLRQFSTHHEDELLVYCIIHLLTQRSLPDTDELKRLTTDHEKLHLFLISEQANYLDKTQQNVLEQLATTHAGLTGELVEHMKRFFLGISDQFDQR